MRGGEDNGEGEMLTTAEIEKIIRVAKNNYHDFDEHEEYVRSELEKMQYDDTYELSQAASADPGESKMSVQADDRLAVWYKDGHMRDFDL